MKIELTTKGKVAARGGSRRSSVTVELTEREDGKAEASAGTLGSRVARQHDRGEHRGWCSVVRQGGCVVCHHRWRRVLSALL